jgi:enoyl-CoA hydratase
MSYEYILTEVHERVGLVQLNSRRTLNSLSSALMRELAEALMTFDADDGIGCIVITGLKRVFAAGADIKEMSGASAVDMLTTDLIGPWDAITRLRKPLIAAVSGYALGGGCEIAMMADMVIASETAIFGQPEINLGVIPGAGGTQRLVRAVGKALAMEIILNDRRLTAEEACRFGLVNHVYPTDTYLEEALKLAGEIANRAPLAVRLAKESIDAAFEMTLKEGLNLERRNFYFLFSSEDQKEGMDAFLNKRPAEWKGR